MDMTKQEQIEAYARHLVAEARNQGELPALFEEISQILSVFNQQKLEAFFSSETILNQTKADILRLFQKELSPILEAFFDQIVLRSQYPLLYPSLAEVIHYSQAAMGEYDMTLTTVLPLSASQKLRLIEKTENLLDLKVRQVIEVLDPDILGGFIVEVNHKVVDASVRHQLQQLKNEMK